MKKPEIIINKFYKINRSYFSLIITIFLPIANVLMKLFLILFFGLFLSVSFAQDFPSNFQSRKVAINDTIQIDSVSINPIRFQIIDTKGIVIDASKYQVDFGKSLLILPKSIVTKNDTLTINYLRYPEYLTKDYFVLDWKVMTKIQYNTIKFLVYS